MKTKVLLLALLAQLFALSASAYDAKVGSIYYNLDTSNKTATVTAKDNYSYRNSYSGSITIPTNITYNGVSYKVTTIGFDAFYDCPGLTSVSIPSSITTIDTQAFYGCTGLTSVTIPASVKSIGWGAFRDCSKLASISIPSSVTLIDCYALDGTPWRESWLASQQDGPCYINTVLYTYKGTMPQNTTIVVNDGTTCIAGQAFEGCSNLVSVEIPQSVTSICSYAFKGSGLKGITFPTSLSYLGGSVLRDCTDLIAVEVPAYDIWPDSYFCYGCTSLISATLAEGIKIVGSNTFGNCTSLTTVTLPSTITKIYSRAFSNCNNLSIVKAKMSTPPSIDSEVFTNRFLATLIVPEGCKEAYQNAEYWQDFQEIIEMVSVSEIILSETNVTLDLVTNTSITLTAAVLPENAMNKSITWSSSNPDVAGVDDDGRVTAVGLGQAVITVSATDGSGVSASCAVTVTDPDPVSINLNSNSVSLEVGGTKQLTATVSPEGASQSVTWSVYSGSSVASVSESGLITAKAAGTATIRATSSVKSSVYKDCTVTVTKPDPVSISLNCTAASMELGETRQLKATVLPSGASQDVTWSVYSGSSVVSVDESGLITANAVGVAKIRATSSVKSSVYKDCTVTVTKPAPVSISINNSNVSLETGETTQLVASILPNEASQSVTWSSNNPDVATVDDDGKVTAASPGEAVITASATEDSNINASCTIIVVDAGDTDISQLDNIIYLEPTEVNVGTTMTLSFRMKNSAAIRAFQFDLYLPEGMTAAKNSKGRIIAALNNGRLPEDDEHTLTIQEQTNGSIRFQCNSLYEETFTGNEGEILTLTVNIADDVVTSEYPVVMKDMRLTEIDTSKYYEHSYIKTTLRGPGCATPTIIYAGGKLKFSCETEGVEFVSTITDDDIKSYRKDEVELSATYTISVYATKPGYTDSDVVTGTLCWIEQQPTTENIVDEDAVTEVKALPVLIQTQGSTISVQGLDAGTEVSVYSIDGKKEGSAISIGNQAVINTNLTSGSIAIVKIGEKSIKVLVK